MTVEEPVAQNATADVHLTEYWGVLVKHRRMIALSVLVACCVGLVVSLLSSPLFRATTILNVEPEAPTPFDVGATPAYAPYNPAFLATQTRLMTSREVAQRVVERLRLADGTSFIAGKSGLASRKDAAAAQRSIEAAEALRSRVTVEPVRGTNLVALSVVDPSGKRAADLANALAEAYIDWNIESKYQVIGQATRFLGTQIEQLRSDLDLKEQQLLAYGRAKDIVSTDATSNVTMQSLESFNRDYAAAVSDRVSKEARFYELQTAKPEAVADSLSNGLVSQLRNDQLRLEREYAEKLNLYKPEWPAMQQLKAQIDKGRQHLASVTQETVAKARDVARTDYLTALRREQSLKGVVQGQKSEAMTLNSNAIEYNNLRTEVETKRTLLDNLLKRQAETEVSSRLRGERVSTIRIVDRALPSSRRFRPSYQMNAAMSLFFGVGFGVLLAFALEYLDRSLRSAEQVERFLGLPAIGVIPDISAKAGGGYGYGYGYGHGHGARRPRQVKPAEDPRIELAPMTQPRSVIAESYRAFRASLLLSRAGGVNTILITSSVAGEGKTATALNLAIVLGQLEKKVLLVDADLHKPRIHETLQLSNRIGLVSVLAENLEPAAAIRRTNVPNVWVVTSGPMSPNPSGLLSSEAMRRFLAEVASNYDYVVIDSPPVGAVADAMLLGAQVDGAVLCVRAGDTPRELVSRAKEKLIRNNTRVLGVIINRLNENVGGYSQYYRGYASDEAGDQRGAAQAAG